MTSDPRTESGAPPDPPVAPLLRNRPFLALWSATSIQLIINSALQFVLLIWVLEQTGSPFASTLLVICLAAPPVATGAIAGVLLDRLDKRRVLIVAVIIRAGLTALLLLADNVSVGAVYAVAFGTALAGQFAVPAGAAALPRFVARQQLLSANSAFQFTATSMQLIGLVVLAPIMLKVIGFDVSYILSAVALACSAVLLACLPALTPFDRVPHRVSEDVGQIRAAFAATLSDIRATGALVWQDRLTALALIQLISGVMMLFMFAVLVPQFVHDVLGRAEEDAVFVFWPTGFGALLALVCVPWLGRRFRIAAMASVGLAVITVIVTMFGVLDFLRSTGSTQDWLLAATLIMAFPLGLAYAMVNAPAQTLLQERAPPAMRGRLFSTQMMLANAVSMLALLLVGGVSDAAGVRQGLFLLGGGLFAITVASIWLGRSGPAPPAPAGDGLR
ncbi:MAG: MFS transporter [Chloroflexi bacterium]|nr:MFS transporter [Chloroflexota bacterium]MYD16395.1 MFS transporter [Chloroflexota bacterium]